MSNHIKWYFPTFSLIGAAHMLPHTVECGPMLWHMGPPLISLLLSHSLPGSALILLVFTTRLSLKSLCSWKTINVWGSIKGYDNLTGAFFLPYSNPGSDLSMPLLPLIGMDPGVPHEVNNIWMMWSTHSETHMFYICICILYRPPSTKLTSFKF